MSFKLFLKISSGRTSAGLAAVVSLKYDFSKTWQVPLTVFCTSAGFSS